MASVIHHPGGFVEVSTEEGALLLTEEEFARVRRRGISIEKNQRVKALAPAEGGLAV